MRVIDSKLASCYYDVSIIPYWTYEVQIVVRVAIWRGNQVQVLSDPVTVTEERLFDIPLYDSMRRGKEVMILKSGNLLCMARLNFRVKCNNQLRVSATQSVVCWLEAGIFFMEFACSYELYLCVCGFATTDQNPLGVWLNGRRYYSGCIRSLRIFERIHCLPRSSIANPLK